MKITNEFKKYLENNNIELINGDSVKLKEVKNVQKLYKKMEKERNLKTPMNKSLEKYKDQIVELEIDNIPRNNQDQTKYKIEIMNDWKNHDEGTWGANFKGSVQNMYNFLVKELGDTPVLANYLLESEIEELKDKKKIK